MVGELELPAFVLDNNVIKQKALNTGMMFRQTLEKSSHFHTSPHRPSLIPATTADWSRALKIVLSTTF